MTLLKKYSRAAIGAVLAYACGCYCGFEITGGLRGQPPMTAAAQGNSSPGTGRFPPEAVAGQKTACAGDGTSFPGNIPAAGD